MSANICAKASSKAMLVDFMRALSFQDRVFIPGPLLDKLGSPAELLEQLPAHTRKFEVVLGSPDTVAGRLDLQKTALLRLVVFELASRRVCIRCEIGEQLNKLVRLSNEKSVRSKSPHGPHCSPLCIGWANNRTDREVSAQERGRLRHDQVGLQRLRLVCSEVQKRHR